MLLEDCAHLLVIWHAWPDVHYLEGLFCRCNEILTSCLDGRIVVAGSPHGKLQVGVGVLYFLAGEVEDVLECFIRIL